MGSPRALRPAYARLACLASLLVATVAAVSTGAAFAASDAHAAETAGDVETDHLDPTDDGGPRTWGFALRPLAAELGLVGLELGAALGSSAVLTVEGDWLLLAPTAAYGATLGVAFYPTRFAFHGLYVHPRVAMWHLGGGDAVGAGGVIGYEWTTRAGATLRLGAGLTYVASSGSSPSMTLPPPLDTFLPELDAAAGWVF